MSLAIVHSRASIGVKAALVTIEVHISMGMPGLHMVGLPEKAVKESKDRVRSAIINNGFKFPSHKTIINLAPADLPKEGARFDLPIALGILAATGQISPASLEQYEFIGELALTGDLKPIKAVLPTAIGTAQAQRALILPSANASEAAIATESIVYGASNLRAVCRHLQDYERLLRQPSSITEQAQPLYPDLSDVRGQFHAKRALEIAAAGGHSVLFTGPPGTGKTMLSSRLPGILPQMTDAEAQSTAMVYSISSEGFHIDGWGRRPFRAPHHTASSVALVGGGGSPKPGEISLAHNGVLFLDELPEFHRHVLDSLREPLESGMVTISRAARQAQFPAKFQLVAAMNPCPCGYYGDPSGRCHCSKDHVSRYQGKLSGPLLDRIDMHVTVPALPTKILLEKLNEPIESSASVRERVIKAREKQYQRANCINAQLSSDMIQQHCLIAEADLAYLENAFIKLGLSARAYHRILKLARTIADLSETERISKQHLQEALGYRAVR